MRLVHVRQAQTNFSRLIDQAHALRAGSYRTPHRDRFDRMLAAQAKLDDQVLLSADCTLVCAPCKSCVEPGSITQSIALGGKLCTSAEHRDLKARSPQGLSSRRVLSLLLGLNNTSGIHTKTA